MFPVYFLAVQDRTGNYVSYAVVNGQTGKVAADLPIDFKKYVLGSFIITIPLFFLLNGFFVFTPTIVLIIGIILGIISLILSVCQLNELERRENNDGINKKVKVKSTNNIIPIIGLIFFMGIFVFAPFVSIIGIIMMCTLLSTTNKKSKLEEPTQKVEEKKEKPKSSIKKTKYLIKPILGIIAGIGVFIINFVDDIYYYGAAIAILLLIIWSFYDLVKEHNMLTKNKLPQLEKRGGDEIE